MINIFKIVDQGILNKKYSFIISYSKQFCWDTGDDERLTCSDFACESVATVDSDAVVDFETEVSRKNCQKIPGTDSNQSF